LPTDETQTVTGQKVLDTGRIDTELALILLDRSNVFISAKDQLFFGLPPSLHDMERNDDRRQDCCCGDHADQCSERESRVRSGGFHYCVLVKD
jgi:hypothetical protein